MDDDMYGAAGDYGDSDDVEMYDDAGAPVSTSNRGATIGAPAMILVALVALWVLGGYVFKGSNQS